MPAGTGARQGREKIVATATILFLTESCLRRWQVKMFLAESWTKRYLTPFPGGGGGGGVTPPPPGVGSGAAAVQALESDLEAI